MNMFSLDFSDLGRTYSEHLTDITPKRVITTSCDFHKVVQYKTNLIHLAYNSPSW